MPKPNIFISHRWDYNVDYHQLVRKFDQYGFTHHDYSVPQHDPLDVNRRKQIAAGLHEQVRQCNFFIIFARMASDSVWCRHEVRTASSFRKPILAVRPYGYVGGIPMFIQEAQSYGGAVGFNTPAIIRTICNTLNWPVPRV